MRSVAAFLRALAPIAVIGACLGTTLLGGCGLLPDVADETAGWTANKLYAEAKDAMAEGAYDKAIKYFEKLEARFPYGRMDVADGVHCAGDGRGTADSERFRRGSP